MSRVEAERARAFDETEDLTPREIAAGVRGSTAFQQAMAVVLSEALDYIRTSTRTEDYFSGFTLAELMQDRIDDIGPDVDEAAYVDGSYVLNRQSVIPTQRKRVSQNVRSLSGLTRIEELVHLKTRVIAAVDALKGAPRVDLPVTGEED